MLVLGLGLGLGARGGTDRAGPRGTRVGLVRMAARLAKLLSESSSVLARKRARGKACSARLHHEKDFSMHATWLGLGVGLALALALG